jgi:hypothetical protein
MLLGVFAKTSVASKKCLRWTMAPRFIWADWAEWNWLTTSELCFKWTKSTKSSSQLSASYLQFSSTSTQASHFGNSASNPESYPSTLLLRVELKLEGISFADDSSTLTKLQAHIASYMERSKTIKHASSEQWKRLLVCKCANIAYINIIEC